ncbi:DUF3087 family protein [Thiomicrospira sp. WB1]|uniref:DUF3087 family protein n=1 Tax=Thiomicrospira sp. WB1 TaxID=1685380 RepID=UPI0007463577|nr:DUF3087 family protein [Thiomicrospira sp. WB1]KUJ72139.1 hypothetical protein AVO41_06845 [Thiomicrospira sp. WB1]
MFSIQPMDPPTYRRKTRNATLIIMAMFIVIGMITATTFVEYLKPYNNNLIVLNILGALLGLVITFFIVKWFFADKPWMQEVMYAWRLKRNLMKISNAHETLQEAATNGDTQAMKILRFYHLGLTQMHKLENNYHALTDLKAEKEELEKQMQAASLDLDQARFDADQLRPYLTKQTDE